MLETFPRVPLAHLPTPLERLPRLTDYLGGPEIWVKRDDCTGLATGGNKTRKLEFAMADAIEQGADTVITIGAVQSNHVRQTAAAACKLGLACEVLLESHAGKSSDVYSTSGNILLDRVLGARLHEYPAGTDFDTAADELAAGIRARGGRPYLIPVGASYPAGALGYVNAVAELLEQADDRDLQIDHIVTATGSGGTQAGLLVGLRALRPDIKLLGIGVSAPRQEQEQKVYKVAAETADLIGRPGLVAPKDVVANCDYVGSGYGVPTEAMNEAVLLLARLEGLLLDPVYSGKAMAGMIDLIKKGAFADAASIVFLHTGGSAALFAYADQLQT